MAGSGIVLLDKPQGLSSNAALQRVRRVFRADKAGHGGTLDPMATGMLPIFLDEATRFAGHVIAERKSYVATITFGAETTTADREGEVTHTAPCPIVDDRLLDGIRARFSGRIRQRPPVYSAIKQNGVRLYAMARMGLDVEVPERDVDIHELNPVTHEFTLDVPKRLVSWQIEVTCGSGTYIRSLAVDIAKALGSVGHLSALRRTWVGGFRGFPMVRLDDLESASPATQADWLLPIDRILGHLPVIRLNDVEVVRLIQGQRYEVDEERATLGPSRLLDAEGVFLGLGELDNERVLRVIRLMPTEARRKAP